MTGKERVINFIKKDAVDHAPCMPITMMFAADMIGVPYGRYATEAALQAEGQAVTAETFDLDYVSAISDPGVEAHDWGAKIIFFDDQPPATDESDALIKEHGDLQKLKAPDPGSGKRMANRIEAVRLMKKRCGAERLVEGWVEGPAAESSDLRGINHLMMDFFDDPSFIRDLMRMCADTAIAFAKAQIEAGADIIGVGDAAASLIGPQLYEEFVYPEEKRIIDAIHKAGALTRLHICGNTGPICGKMAETGADIIDIDSLVTPEEAREGAGHEAVLLGIIDPVRILRNGNKEIIRRELELCRDQAGPRFIYGAGCEVPRDTPHANLRTLVEFAGENYFSSSQP